MCRRHTEKIYTAKHFDHDDIKNFVFMRCPAIIKVCHSDFRSFLNRLTDS